ncbi:MAG: pyridoxal phosphate-dependent aminotransferase [Anaerolineae bacterium]
MSARHWEARRMDTIPFSGIRKIFQAAVELERQGKEIIHLEMGRPDFDTPGHIKEAAKQALDDGFVHYTSNYGIPELREAIARKLLVENGIQVDPENEVIVTVGANEAILLAMLALLDPDDEVLIPDPVWLHYFYCARLAGARPVHVPLREENGFQFDPSDLERAITPKARMIVVNSPHNPSGAVLDKETLEAIAQIAIRHDLLVISDEIYEKIIYDGVQHHSLASLPGMAERTLTVNGFSKAYSMTGWRLGYVAARKNLIDALIRVHQYSATCATSFAQKGAVAAYRASQDCVREMVSEFDRRRRFLVETLETIDGIHCVRPRGAFYVFPSVKKLGVDDEKLASYLLHEASVALVPGSAFGEYGQGHLRLSYANSYQNIATAVERIAEALRRLPTDLQAGPR